jgi:hypothetical protein
MTAAFPRSAITRDVVPIDDDAFAVTATQDVGPILDANKEDQSFSTGYTPSRDLKLVARIPLVVAEHWLNAYGVNVLDPNHKAAVRRLLNDRDWLFLRTSSGRLRK